MKFNIGDIVEVVVPVSNRDWYEPEWELSQRHLRGRIHEVRNGAYVVEFDYNELVAFDPDVADPDLCNIFGTWRCDVFDNRRGRIIYNELLKMAWEPAQVVPNVDGLREILGE